MKVSDTIEIPIHHGNIPTGGVVLIDPAQMSGPGVVVAQTSDKVRLYPCISE